MKFGNFCVNEFLNVFVTLPIMTLESNQIWHFQGPGSRDLTTGYTNIWVRDEGLQRSTFLLDRLIITFVMTNTATCFDFKRSYFEAIEIKFLILWNLATWRYTPSCLNIQPNNSSQT
jgi:hypothetical protein